MRRCAAGGGWNFPAVFEELTFVAVPVTGFVLASRRPANKGCHPRLQRDRAARAPAAWPAAPHVS